MHPKITQGLIAVSLAVGLAACSAKLQSVSDNSNGSMNADPSRREAVTIGVNVSERSTGFRLAGANSFAMTLDGCVSGLSYDNITQNNPSVQAYKYDQHCKVKLQSFVLNGITYVASADGFDSYDAGDSAVFEESSASSNRMNVRVASQLGDPIRGTEAVSYTVTRILAGEDETIARNVVGDSHALSVSGVDAASVDVVGVSFSGMTSGGAGQFAFKLECLDPIAGAAPNRTCGSNALTGMKYRLIEDTAGGVLSYAAAEALFAGSACTAVTDAQIFTTGKGGINTVSLSGPDQMHLHPHMLLVIQSGGSSYRYFNVDVTTLIYPAP